MSTPQDQEMEQKGSHRELMLNHALSIIRIGSTEKLKLKFYAERMDDSAILIFIIEDEWTAILNPSIR